MPHRRIAFALDYPSLGEARAGALALRGNVGLVKVGLELFVKEGPRAFAIAEECGADLFADLKLHDIPDAGQDDRRRVDEHALAAGVMLGDVGAQRHDDGNRLFQRESRA